MTVKHLNEENDELENIDTPSMSVRSALEVFENLSQSETLEIK
jgi:hypothetical protein